MTLPDFWFTPAVKKHWFKTSPTLDKQIYDKYSQEFWLRYHQWLDTEDLLATVLMLDQIIRHLLRVPAFKTNNPVELKLESTYRAFILVTTTDPLVLKTYSGEELAFLLMPIKHLYDYRHNGYSNGYALIHRLCTTHPDLDKGLMRFLTDSHKKYQLSLRPYLYISTSTFIDQRQVCEPGTYSGSFDQLHQVYNRKEFIQHPVVLAIQSFLSKYKIFNICISLSGGVDSMVIAYILMQLGYQLVAYHQNYGNREVAAEEADFVLAFCNYFNIPIYYHQIKYLRRHQLFPATFYEETTRAIRFQSYAYVCQQTNSQIVALGTIKDDKVENVFFNFCLGQHLNQLGRIEPISEERNINLCRPLYDVWKADVYDLASKYKIPYLKNTTPSWHKRGRYREQLEPLLIEMFGPQLKEKVILNASYYANQHRLIQQSILEPFVAAFTNSGNDGIGNSIYTAMIDQPAILLVVTEGSSSLWQQCLGLCLDKFRPITTIRQQFINYPKLRSINHLVVRLHKLKASQTLDINLSRQIRVIKSPTQLQLILKV